MTSDNPVPESLGFLEFNADLSAPEIIATYDELPLWSAMFGLLLLEHVPLENVHLALDVGCGTGFPLIELAERLGPRRPRSWNRSVVGCADTREREDCESRYQERHRARGRRDEDAVR